MITVIEPGRFTSIQDEGRGGFAHLGVPRAGAADSLSLRHANLLVGNPQGAAALEMTLHGPTLRFAVDALIALTGGRMQVYLDDVPLPMYQSVSVCAGQVLACGPLLTGMRGYLAVGGGISTAQLLASAATDTLAGLGPPVLRAGDCLTLRPHSLLQGRYLRSPPEFSEQVTLRVITGPHQEWFPATALGSFLDGCYRVRADSDRSGIRLAGATVVERNPGELPSQGMLTGAVQVPGDGQPIVLLPNHGTTGGYPVIAVVISADLPQLGQLRPGVLLRFQAVNREQALQALRYAAENLRTASVCADPGLLEARGLMLLAKAHPALREACLQLGRRRVRLRR